MTLQLEFSQVSTANRNQNIGPPSCATYERRARGTLTLQDGVPPSAESYDSLEILGKLFTMVRW